tara:strand:- start:4837 stop:5544 length:708 start_codon:yes stop_codon:yes gene_type:complete
LAKNKANGLFRLQELMQRKAILPKPIKKFTGKLLVLAAHPDDDVLGCGATLCNSISAGAKAEVVYCTSNSLREKEAIKASRVLGLENILFLKHVDAKLQDAKGLAAELTEVIDRFEPDIVFSNNFLDSSSDHMALSRALYKACISSSKKFDVCLYEFWQPLPAVTHLVDADKGMAKKLLAMDQHGSQTKDFDFASIVKSLNAYRALQRKGQLGKFAEAFFTTPKKDFVKLAEAMK